MTNCTCPQWQKNIDTPDDGGKEGMNDILTEIKEKLIMINKSHHTGYDFNADPENITLLEGDIFLKIDKAIASKSEVEYCDNCGGILKLHCNNCFNGGANNRTPKMGDEE